MMRRRVAVVAGTRPEVIKLAPVWFALREHEGFEPSFVVTAQHRDLLDQMLATFGIVADVDLDVMTHRQRLHALGARVLAAFGEWLEQARPDTVVVQGDTTTAHMAALAAFYAGVPIAHVEAGLRTGDLAAPFPEEQNRRAISIVTRWHFAPTAIAAANLVAESVPKQQVFVVGNTVVDALQWAVARTPRITPPVTAPYILFTCHRRESLGAPMRELFFAVRDFARAHPEIGIWYPVHPNPDVLELARATFFSIENVVLTKPLSYLELVAALVGCHVVLTDSGGLQEEAVALGRPVVVTREVTERPEGVAAGKSLLVGTRREAVIAALERTCFDDDTRASMNRGPNPYGDGKAAPRIAHVLADEPWEPFTP